MIEVELPDGTIAEFPDNTPQDVMRGALQKRFASEKAKTDRDAYYSSGIYAGKYNPLGPIAKTVDAFASGAQRGPLLGWDDEAAAALNTAGGTLGDYEQARRNAELRKGAQEAQNPVASTAGELAGFASLAPVSPTAHAINSGAGLLRTSLASGLEGGVLGAIQGAGDARPGERLENAGYGAVGGTLIGGAIPGATKAMGALARKVISPFPATAERAAAVDALAREGIETSAGQKTGSDALRYAESEIGGNAARDLFERQGEQFTKAALSRAGINASRATPEVIDDAFRTIGNEFDTLASRNAIAPDAKLAQDMGDVWREYASLTPDNARAPIVQNMIQDIGKAIQGAGTLDGAAYQSARSRLDKAARASVRDPQLQQALYGLRSSLDDAMERSIAVSNPADAGLWQEARNKYRNMLVLEKAATRAGEDAAQGIISPSALRGATVTGQGRRNYARGRGDFAELARAGESVMRPMPNSGTAARLGARLGPGILGFGYGAYSGDPTAAITAGLAGAAAPKALGAAMMSRLGQTLLSNQAAEKMALDPRARALLGEILLGGQAGEASGVGRAIVGP